MPPQQHDRGRDRNVRSRSPARDRSRTRTAPGSGNSTAVRDRYQQQRDQSRVVGEGRPRVRSRNERSRQQQDRGIPRSAVLTIAELMDYEVLSFRNFILTQEDSVTAEDALSEYVKYKDEYQKHNTERFVRDNLEAGFMIEKYHPLSFGLQEEQQQLRCKLNARLFREELEATGGFTGIRLVSSDTVKQRKSKGDEEPRTDVRVGRNGRPTSPYYLDHPASKSLVIENIPTRISKWQIADKVKDIAGYAGVLMSDPRAQDELCRTSWVLFDSIEARDAAEEHLLPLTDPLEVDDFKLCFEGACLPENCKSRVTPACSCSNEVMASHLQLTRQLIETFDSAWSVNEKESTNGSMDVENVETEIPSWLDTIGENHTLAECLDMQLVYLRRVHNICFYSGKRCVDEMQLWSLCGSLYVRPNATEDAISASCQSADDKQWLQKLEEIAAEMLEHTHTATVTEQAQLIDMKWNAYCEEHTLKVDEDRYRCDICRKLFKGTDFVAKHLKAKHLPAYNEVVDKVATSIIPQNYRNDIHKLVIFPSKEAPLISDRKHREVFMDWTADYARSHMPPQMSMPPFMSMGGGRVPPPPPGYPPPPDKPYGSYTDWDRPTNRHSVDRPTATTTTTTLLPSDGTSVEGRPVVYYDDL
eukprot:GHVS01065624.1.p1 GENE.GHVS01065624.1~~GHVS01065624.1.p1  ORF type:complete len:669 (+),score=81.48 GHVS01065624.1:79-2007(+)